jgi:ATP/ADP translocase
MAVVFLKIYGRALRRVGWAIQDLVYLVQAGVLFFPLKNFFGLMVVSPF